MVLHARRGDFEDHCKMLAVWSSDWNGINTFPQFAAKDHFDQRLNERKDITWGDPVPENYTSVSWNPS